MFWNLSLHVKFHSTCSGLLCDSVILIILKKKGFLFLFLIYIETINQWRAGFLKQSIYLLVVYMCIDSMVSIEIECSSKSTESVIFTDN